MALLTIGFVAGLATAGLVALVLHRQHEHDWELLDTDVYKYSIGGGDVTVVRLRCCAEGCGRFEEQRHAGRIPAEVVARMYSSATAESAAA